MLLVVVLDLYSYKCLGLVCFLFLACWAPVANFLLVPGSAPNCLEVLFGQPTSSPLGILGSIGEGPGLVLDTLRSTWLWIVQEAALSAVLLLKTPWIYPLAAVEL